MKDNVIICVGRQFGSGGHSIAKLLAKRFGAKFYDRELLNLAAKESGFSEKFFEENDEQKGFFRSLFNIDVPYLSESGFYGNKFSQQGLFEFQCDAIRSAVKEGSCVFVGRCADYVLRDDPNIVSVFISADITDRVVRVMQRGKDCSEENAKKIICDKEGERSSYYNYYTGKKWGDAASYDLCINSSILGIDATEEIVAEFIKRRFSL